jgi:hypothetical protein
MLNELLPYFTTAAVGTAAGTVGRAAAAAAGNYLKETLEEVGVHTAQRLFANGVVGATLPMMISNYQLNKLAKASHGHVPAYELKSCWRRPRPEDPRPLPSRACSCRANC